MPDRQWRPSAGRLGATSVEQITEGPVAGRRGSGLRDDGSTVEAAGAATRSDQHRTDDDRVWLGRPWDSCHTGGARCSPCQPPSERFRSTWRSGRERCRVPSRRPSGSSPPTRTTFSRSCARSMSVRSRWRPGGSRSWRSCAAAGTPGGGSTCTAGGRPSPATWTPNPITPGASPGPSCGTRWSGRCMPRPARSPFRRSTGCCARAGCPPPATDRRPSATRCERPRQPGSSRGWGRGAYRAGGRP